MRTTDFAGLTVLAPGEPLSADGYSLQARNPDTIDTLLRIGAQAHRHDAHAALATPTGPLTGAVLTTGGSFPAATTVALVYTLIDAFGGETLPITPPLELVTPAKLDAPNPPTGVPAYTAGSMLAGTYQYVLTWTDGAGGESLPSPVRTIVVEPGHANAKIDFTGLSTGMPAGATGWRLYKSARGSFFLFVAAGAGATLTDDGTLCADCVGRAPSVNTTLDRNRVQVTMPGSFPAGAVAFRLYGSVGANFTTPSFFGQYPTAGNAGATFTFASWNPADGAPPVRPTAIGGAERIDPERDISGFRWRTPVANAAALPAVGNVRGDVRVTLNDFAVHVWDETVPGWVSPSWGGPAGAWTALTYSSATYVSETGFAFGGGKFTHDTAEIVRLRGGIMATAVGAEGDLLATLPVGARPAVQEARVVPFWHASATAWAQAIVTILADGSIYVTSTFGLGVNTGDEIILSGITFRTT